MLVSESDKGDSKSKCELYEYKKDPKLKAVTLQAISVYRKKAYKAKIIRLAKEVQSRSAKAEKELKYHLSKPNTKKIIEQFLKKQRQRKIHSAYKGKVGSKRPVFGNAFKPYQGGIPGLGKRS